MAVFWYSFPQRRAENKPPFIMAVFIFVKIPEFCIFVPHFLPNPNGGLLSAMMLFPFYANAIPVTPVGCFCSSFDTPVNNGVGPAGSCAKTSYVCDNGLKYTSCDTCNSDYRRVSHQIGNSTCVYYECKAGCGAGNYYNNGCYSCPRPGTSEDGSGGITSCYIPANQLTGSDSTGSWTCTSAAYYQN